MWGKAAGSQGSGQAVKIRAVSKGTPSRRWAAALRLLGTSQAFGVDPIRLALAVADIPRFIHTAMQYKTRNGLTASLPLTVNALRPCLGEHRESAGRVDKHYFYQDLWAARLIHCLRPASHVDIGSRIDGFIAHVLCFTSVTVIDIRAQPLEIEGLTFVQDDATELKRFSDASLRSVSSLHAIEHFGLGRYGDPVDPGASLRAIESLQRVLACDGRLYFSVPIGRERLEFNAHRVFAPSTILDAFSKLQLLSFAAVNDAGQFLAGIDPESLSNSDYACGLFEFTKRSEHPGYSIVP
jgi:hypothetical protein